MQLRRQAASGILRRETASTFFARMLVAKRQGFRSTTRIFSRASTLSRTSSLSLAIRSLFLESRSMMTRFVPILLLLGTIPVWAQVQPAATGGGLDDERMQMPAPVSGETYPMTGTDEVRTNFLAMGVNFNTSYDDNVVENVSSKPVGDETYSISPTISLDELTTRQHRMFAYSAGFLFYEPTSALNSVQQSASARFQYRTSPRTTFTLSDGFQQSSNPFNQASSILGEPISGSPQPSNAVVIRS